MEFFLVFILGVVLALVVLFVTRPSLFSRSEEDYNLLEITIEESLERIDQREKEAIEKIEERQKALLELYETMLTNLEPKEYQSPKVLAVLALRDKKEDANSIAKQLGLGVGEVQLILELNKEL